ncbi:MAG: hypothetical protein INF43_00695 [Alphaproteobacteria bacterium]|nr:hypothetical protein [Alphaproteobacteria bacterium]
MQRRTWMVSGMVVVAVVVLASTGLAQDGEPSGTFAPVVPGLTAEGLESWFFSFLEKLLNLFAQFIGQILQQIFGGVSGLLTGTPPTTSV